MTMATTEGGAWQEFLRRYEELKRKNRQVVEGGRKETERSEKLELDVVAVVKQKLSSHKRKPGKDIIEDTSEVNLPPPIPSNNEYNTQSFCKASRDRTKRLRLDTDISGDVPVSLSKQKDTFKFLKAQQVMKQLKTLCSPELTTSKFSQLKDPILSLDDSEVQSGSKDNTLDIFKPMYTPLRERILLIPLQPKPNQIVSTKRKTFDLALLRTYREILSRYRTPCSY